MYMYTMAKRWWVSSLVDCPLGLELKTYGSFPSLQKFHFHSVSLLL